MLNYNDFPVGITNFSEIIEKKCILIDKTMFIKDIMDEKVKALLITRPRRFGKTLNMNMLGEFFSLTGKDVFGGLNISKEIEFCAAHQNQYPVISMTFKECKGSNFEGVLKKIKAAISDCYESHRYLAQSRALPEKKRKEFERVLDKEMDDPYELSHALKNLISYLYVHTGKNAVVLIDEYDSPIHSAYSCGFYNQIIEFMRDFLGAALKDNSYLEKAVMTGIARVAKESMFSGVNHLGCYTLMDKRYAQYFGFTQSEVESLFDQKHAESIEEIKKWYNGYKIGEYEIYNPWSIMHCLKNDMTMDVYWLNTSDNALVYELIGNSDLEFKTKIQNLIKGIPQEQTIEDSLTFREMKGNDTAIWTLLFHAGYLNIVSQTRDAQNKKNMTIEIPNMEIMSLYVDIVEKWFALDNQDHYYLDFIKSLEGDNPDKFLDLVSAYIKSSLSYFDLHKKTPEYVFHIFMMGLLVGFRGKYDVNSNKEAGDGRYDVIMTPKDPKNKAILMEFKAVDSENKLQAAAKDALQQMSDKRYTDAFSGSILALGMAFCGKKMVGLYRNFL